VAEAKTIRVIRNPVYSNRYDSEDRTVGVYVTGGPYFDREALDITITPVLSRKERLREARRAALDGAGWHNETPVLGWASLSEILAIIERVDAEFAKGEK
jgi:hypothetical protein